MGRRTTGHPPPATTEEGSWVSWGLGRYPGTSRQAFPAFLGLPPAAQAASAHNIWQPPTRWRRSETQIRQGLTEKANVQTTFQSFEHFGWEAVFNSKFGLVVQPDKKSEISAARTLGFQLCVFVTQPVLLPKRCNDIGLKTIAISIYSAIVQALHCIDLHWRGSSPI